MLVGPADFAAAVRADEHGPVPHARQTRPPGARRTARDREVHSAGPEHLPPHRGVRPRRIHVAENGPAHRDAVRPDSWVHDPERTRRLAEHFAVGARAVRKEAPLAGCFAWSLLDGFEWAYGNDKRFGPVHVDHATRRRTSSAVGGATRS
ncbi:family 1 glycosylhydrolase [Streptomyces sp. NPDC058008]|uniref:family 1 glycosylhydrolase n=1 Tax=Streptomyces sp. NPDC058008 TaxID=3346303 RepID=UPI0036E1B943